MNSVFRRCIQGNLHYLYYRRHSRNTSNRSFFSFFFQIFRFQIVSAIMDQFGPFAIFIINIRNRWMTTIIHNRLNYMDDDWWYSYGRSIIHDRPFTRFSSWKMVINIRNQNLKSVIKFNGLCHWKIISARKSCTWFHVILQ